ncbi:MAG: hypothetical protein Q9188_006490 [Gyalolechia gomerana]
MPEPVRNTVDRLDRPSAYYLGRNKRRKFNKDHVGREDRERTPEAPEDPLKDATTLYVGNLYAERETFIWGFEEQCEAYEVVDELTRRGKSGGQVRDEYRDEYDPGRGGYGRAIAEERLKEEEEYGRGR